MKRRRKQVTCTYPAYSFPHRLSGGKCLLTAYIENYFYNDRTLCSTCISNKETFCEVAVGQESTRYCQKVVELEDFHEINFTHK